MSILCRLGFHKWGGWICDGPAWYMEPIHFHRICLRCHKKGYKTVYG